MARDDPKLTGKQRMFVEYYLGESRFNATVASRLAGYAGDDNALAVNGSQLLRNPKIQAEIAGRVTEAAMTANEVLARLSRHASASLADVLDDDGDFSLKRAKQRGTDDLLKKLKVRKTTRREKNGDSETEVTYEYELHDPQAALVHLGRFHKLFTDNQNIVGTQEIRVVYGSGSNTSD